MTAAPQFALVDVNNFYVSCERVFQPRLEGIPLVVQGSGTTHMTSGTVMVHARRLRCIFAGILLVNCRMVMCVVTRVLGSRTGFVLAIAGHCCPAVLQGQQN